MVAGFNRTTGELSLFTNDTSHQGLEIDYAIRCEAVFSKSGVQNYGWISVSGGQIRSSTNSPVRYGDDSIFALNHQISSSCSDDSFSASDYEDLLPKNQLKDVEFHLYGSVDPPNSCEELKCAPQFVWNWFECQCQCPDAHLCDGNRSLPDFNPKTCGCECNRKPECCPHKTPTWSQDDCACICSLTPASCTGALPTLNEEICACHCPFWDQSGQNMEIANARCNAEHINYTFSQSTCSCVCQHWIDASQDQLQADINCVTQKGPGYTFSTASCSCVFNEPPSVLIKFRGCAQFLLLDTDNNLPTYDVDPITL